MNQTPEKYFIGIDIGTGSTKAVGINLKGAMMATSQVYYSAEDLHDGYSEQDPEMIWGAFKNCVVQLIEKIKYPPVSISFSSAMHGVMAVNEQKKPISNLIIWADTRSEKIAEQIRKSKEAKSIYRVTGTPIHAMTPLCKIIWLRKNNAAIFKKTYKFISIKEFVWFRLFGVY